MCMALWVRGLLENVFGVNTNKLSYRIGGLNEPGHEECLSLDLSPGMDVVAIPPDTTFDALLNAGELGAVIASSPPKAFVEDEPQITSLFTVQRQRSRITFDELEYFRS